MILKDKNVLVVGMAKSGIPTVKALSKLDAKITINDIKSRDKLKDILNEIEGLCDNIILGFHPEKIEIYDLIILSPGVPTDLPFLKKAEEENKMIIGELELAYRLSKGKYLAITGTNGKTTTTALTGEICRNGGLETFVVGNIGLPAISKAFKTTDDTVLVTEVSSFQLETIDTFKPKISAILNITPDHLNRHKTMKNYIDAKAKIFMNQDKNDILILNYDNDITRKLADRARSRVLFFSRNEILEEGVYLEDNNIVVKINNHKEIICNANDIYISGKHNLENALAAVAFATNLGIKREVIKYTLMNFKGVEHRTEYIGSINGIKFYNDSKGTNPDASIKAVEGLEAPLILIAGGMDKGSCFDEFVRSFNNKVKELILLGETALKIKQTAEKYGFKNVSIVENMEEAVNKAYKKAEENDTILLSPACASWDMYESYEVRGRHFKECVEKLRRS
ncbi:UDP-N-acetylmuramoyl-L-alanine--D-glutamate ligase [Paramaledivibacter caminithermalis]|uniref:UDP-N-acetylmuramoylalanine--D-glutamate ligase n=1 Tax=Paramaledivibacter caminithermalis (strain DSM 15212 / CIP 107654 / DViRD3) TaxID=1121301 RepID=A0A1M6S1Q6_PARC5|nr:UDP-N-acetylmuramoyl-L-alanine--D-glutamate ligase [Paramaledivibacter caminithermalis]SHK38596.1 UDP-N-acetylmuramoylalanine--D-glutamate ligase [Paramaledivibacter caminithermalis DSM 15212]